MTFAETFVFFSMISTKLTTNVVFQMTTQNENENENENDIYENKNEKINEKNEIDKLKYNDDVNFFVKFM